MKKPVFRLSVDESAYFFIQKQEKRSEDQTSLLSNINMFAKLLSVVLGAMRILGGQAHSQFFSFEKTFSGKDEELRFDIPTLLNEQLSGFSSETKADSGMFCRLGSVTTNLGRSEIAIRSFVSGYSKATNHLLTISGFQLSIFKVLPSETRHLDLGAPLHFFIARDPISEQRLELFLQPEQTAAAPPQSFPSVSVFLSGTSANLIDLSSFKVTSFSLGDSQSPPSLAFVSQKHRSRFLLFLFSCEDKTLCGYPVNGSAFLRSNGRVLSTCRRFPSVACQNSMPLSSPFSAFFDHFFQAFVLVALIDGSVTHYVVTPTSLSHLFTHSGVPFDFIELKPIGRFWVGRRETPPGRTTFSLFQRKINGDFQAFESFTVPVVSAMVYSDEEGVVVRSMEGHLARFGFEGSKIVTFFSEKLPPSDTVLGTFSSSQGTFYLLQQENKAVAISKAEGVRLHFSCQKTGNFGVYSLVTSVVTFSSRAERSQRSIGLQSAFFSTELAKIEAGLFVFLGLGSLVLLLFLVSSVAFAALKGRSAAKLDDEISF